MEKKAKDLKTGVRLNIRKPPKAEAFLYIWSIFEGYNLMTSVTLLCQEIGNVLFCIL